MIDRSVHPCPVQVRRPDGSLTGGHAQFRTVSRPVLGGAGRTLAIRVRIPGGIIMADPRDVIPFPAPTGADLDGPDPEVLWVHEAHLAAP